MIRRNTDRPVPVRTVRCAVYTRKSTEEGLEQEFNSLDAQRDSGEAFVKSQEHEGWVCLPEHYDDGGFTGGNMDRPALKQLMADIEAGLVDTVVVYKVDRLSRSLLDFARMMETFDKHQVSFVSVTQQFNTATSMGRLILNVLLSFAQFEREMISERTRDKIAATRRKGKWSGGMPLLGYEVVDKKLVVLESEAERVRQIFALYLELGALIAVAEELNRRGWRTKQWTTRNGGTKGGRIFDKGSVYQVLTNPTYLGKVRYKDEVHDGEHAAIVDPAVFDHVQTMLHQHGLRGGQDVRNKNAAMLKGLLRCTSCDCLMAPSYSSKGNRRYRYYVCVSAQKRGWGTCPAPSLPAGEVERVVLDQIRGIGRDPEVVAETVRQVREQAGVEIAALRRERADLDRGLRRDEAELRQITNGRTPDKDRVSRFAEVQDRIQAAQQRIAEIDADLVGLGRELIDEREVAETLAAFDGVWESLTPQEQTQMMALLIERVDWDGAEENVSITLRPSGIKSLSETRVEAT
jgi:site-specific DNA recombinase